MVEAYATECSIPWTVPARGSVSLGESASVESRPVEITADLVTNINDIRALKPDYEHLYRVTGNPWQAAHARRHPLRPGADHGARLPQAGTAVLAGVIPGSRKKGSPAADSSSPKLAFRASG